MNPNPPSLHCDSGDSGIHSGVTTGAPSINSRGGMEMGGEEGEDMETGKAMFDWDQSMTQGFTQVR